MSDSLYAARKRQRQLPNKKDGAGGGKECSLEYNTTTNI